MTKSELTESGIQGLDLDLEIQIQSSDVIWTNLVRNGDLRAREALHHHRPPHKTADELLRIGVEGFLEQVATHMGLSNHVSPDAQPGPGGKPQRPGPMLGPHHNDTLPNRSVDHRRRRDNDEVSLLASDEGFPDPPQLEQDLSKVCFNPVPDVTPKWSTYEVIASDVSTSVAKLIKKPFHLRSLRFMEHQILITL